MRKPVARSARSGRYPSSILTRNFVERAIETLRRYRINYWDALIVAAAERSGCRKLLSEDLNPDQRYHGIVVVNPFGPATDGASSRQAGQSCDPPSTGGNGSVM